MKNNFQFVLEEINKSRVQLQSLKSVNTRSLTKLQKKELREILDNLVAAEVLLDNFVSGL